MANGVHGGGARNLPELVCSDGLQTSTQDNFSSKLLCQRDD